MDEKEDAETGTDVEQPHARALIYDVDEWPPFAISISVACQHLIGCVGPIVMLTYTVSDVVCLSHNDVIRSNIFCSSLFMVGLSTVIQSMLGIRLPVFQGPSLTFLPPIIAMKSSGAWLCPSPTAASHGNLTDNATAGTGDDVDRETTFARLGELQGSLMLASVVEMLLGATGTVGILLRFVGPIVISVIIFLLGFSLYFVPLTYSRSYWPVAITSGLLVIIFGIYLQHVKVPLPPRCCRKKGTPPRRYSLFDVFAILISMIVTWILCYLLTRAEVFPDDPTAPAYMARTDTRTTLIKTTPWFYFPYPGQFGPPRFNLALFVGFLSVVLSSAMESVGDYLTIGKTCNAVPLPSHAVNRGILVEGAMSVLSAAMGTCHATTSWTANVAIVTLTKVGSRYVLALSGVVAMVLAILGKIGAVLSTMPDPILGGITLVTIGIVLALGLSGLRTVDLTSSRNISVLGMSIFIPIIFSEWLNRYPEGVNTGSDQLDKVIKIVIGFPMISGGIIAIFLDNTVKDQTTVISVVCHTATGGVNVGGTREERGFESDCQDIDSEDHSAITQRIDVNRAYLFDIPYLDRFCGKCKLLKYIPFVQTLSYSKVNHAV